MSLFRPWVYWEAVEIVKFFPNTSPRKGEYVLMADKRYVITKVDLKRKRLKLREAPNAQVV